MLAIGTRREVSSVAEFGHGIVETIRLPRCNIVGCREIIGFRLPLHAEGHIRAEYVNRRGSPSRTGEPALVVQVPKRLVPKRWQHVEKLRIGRVVFQLKHGRPFAVDVEGEQVPVIAADHDRFQVPQTFVILPCLCEPPCFGIALEDDQ